MPTETQGFEVHKHGMGIAINVINVFFNTKFYATAMLSTPSESDDESADSGPAKKNGKCKIQNRRIHSLSEH